MADTVELCGEPCPGVGSEHGFEPCPRLPGHEGNHYTWAQSRPDASSRQRNGITIYEVRLEGERPQGHAVAHIDGTGAWTAEDAGATVELLAAAWRLSGKVADG